MPYNSVIELMNLNQSSIPAAFIPSRAASSGIEPKATNCIKIDRVSSPFSLSLHSTIIGDLFSSTHLVNPYFSSSFRRIERTLG
jgi:hypothetical protein